MKYLKDGDNGKSCILEFVVAVLNHSKPVMKYKNNCYFAMHFQNCQSLH